jgi:hypothetical protein
MSASRRIPQTDVEEGRVVTARPRSPRSNDGYSGLAMRRQSARHGPSLSGGFGPAR